jgi:hypothetical protein
MGAPQTALSPHDPLFKPKSGWGYVPLGSREDGCLPGRGSHRRAGVGSAGHASAFGGVELAPWLAPAVKQPTW